MHLEPVYVTTVGSEQVLSVLYKGPLAVGKMPAWGWEWGEPSVAVWYHCVGQGIVPDPLVSLSILAGL